MLACDNCRITKRKCNRGQPCERCLKRGVKCTYRAVKYKEVFPKRRKIKEDPIYLKAEAFLGKLETTLKNHIMYQYGEDIDLSVPSHHIKNSLKRFNPFASSISSDNSSTFSLSIHSDRFVSTKFETNDLLPSAQLQIYLDTYIQNTYQSYPFINLNHIQSLFKTQPLHSPILYVMYLIGQLILIRKDKNMAYHKIEDNEFYKLIKYLLMVQNGDNSLLQIQTLILLAEVEALHNMAADASMHLVQATRKLQMLDNIPQKVTTASKLMYERGKEATWTIARKVDSIICCISDTPPAIHITQEQLEKSTDNYDSFLLLKSITPEFNRNKLNISGNELLQHNQYLAMELYSFWAYVAQKVQKFKRYIEQFDISQTESIIKQWKQLYNHVVNHKFAKLDGKTFKEEYPIDDPYFNIHLSNYLQVQLHMMCGAIYMEKLIENIKNHSYPSLSAFNYHREEVNVIFVKEHSMNNLIQVLYCEDSDRRKCIDNMRNVDFIFLLPHYFISKHATTEHSQLSQEIALSELENWPCINAVFKLYPDTQPVLNQDQKQSSSQVSEVIDTLLEKQTTPLEEDGFKAQPSNFMVATAVSM